MIGKEILILINKITYRGILNNYVELYKIISYKKLQFIKEINKMSINPYNNIYFTFIYRFESNTGKSFVKTNLRPLWNFQINKYYYDVYAFKLMYERVFNYSVKNRVYWDELVDIAYQEYLTKTNDTSLRHYIVTCISPEEIRVYLVKPITEREAIETIVDCETLLLWELV
jgi:hypothetical protein